MPRKPLPPLKESKPLVIPPDAPRPYFFPPEGPGDTQTIVAIFAPIIARLCAVPAPDPEQPPPAEEK
jgi:hypothetical protein